VATTIYGVASDPGKGILPGIGENTQTVEGKILAAEDSF
jgi:hypothetical protein